MLIAKQFSNSFLSLSAVIDAVRARVNAPSRDETMDEPKPKAAGFVVDIEDPAKMDQARYARLLDHELDRQLLTEVEREDTDMLNRVRAALYDE